MDKEIKEIQLTPVEMYTMLHTGKICRVRFVEKTGAKKGTIRELVGRTGVRKGITGKGRRYDFREKGVILFEDFDLAGRGLPAKDCYRAVSIGSILEITVEGVKYRIQPDPPPPVPEPVREFPDHGPSCFCTECCG